MLAASRSVGRSYQDLLPDNIVEDALSWVPRSHPLRLLMSRAEHLQRSIFSYGNPTDSGVYVTKLLDAVFVPVYWTSRESTR